MPQVRRLAFGSVAELYDHSRPSYPDQLVEDVIAFAAPVRVALEVGAGTGKATTLFAARGIAVRALEPSPEMATIARRNCTDYAQVTIEPSDFEHFDAAGQRFRLIYSAQAWHWVSPRTRYVKAAALLQPGGVLAVFWNRPRWGANPLRNQLRAAYHRTAPDFGSDPGPMHPDTELPPELWGNWSREIGRAQGFGHAEARSYAWTLAYSTAEYLDLIQTHSDHIVLADGQRSRLLNEIATVIDRHGGIINLDYATSLVLARARGVTPN